MFKTKLDRRITLQKPTQTRAAANERLTTWVTVVNRMPAGKLEGVQGDEEGLEGKVMQARTENQWEIRWIRGLVPNTTWRLIDEYGVTHKVIADPSEIGRRQGLLIKTRVLE